MRKLEVRATRAFGTHPAGEVLLVDETPEIKSLVRSKLFEVLSVAKTIEPRPVTEDDPTVEGELPSLAKIKRAPRKKAPAKRKAATKNV